MADRIDKYQPRINEEHWAKIAAFVRDAVREAEPETTYAAGALLTIVTTHTHWAWMEGQPLERSVIFDRWLIERFIATGCPDTWSDATRGNNRSMLFRVAESLLGHQASTRRMSPMKSADPLVPYTDREIARFRGWAMSQVGQEWRRSATVLLSLGLGAGLTTQDLGVLRRRHLECHSDGAILVNTPSPRERMTVVFAEWEDELRQAIAELGDDEYVFRRNRTRPSRNIVTGLIAETTGLFKPEGQRLRATWIVHHLTLGTPIDVVMQAAGITSLRPITRYLKFVPPADSSSVVSHLRFGVRQ